MNNLDKLTIPCTLIDIAKEIPVREIEQRHKKYLKLPIEQICTKSMYISNYGLNKKAVDLWIGELKTDQYNAELRAPCELHPMLNVDCCCYACREWFGCGDDKILWIWVTNP